VWIVLGVIAVVVLVGLVLWWLLSGPDDELDGDDDFAVERKWDWEFELTEEQEKALMAGLQAYHKSKEGPISVNGQSGQLTLFAPYTVISLYLLAQRFVALGPDAVEYPVSTVGRLLDEFTDEEQPGVLHLRDDWFPDQGVDGMDRSAFADVVMDVLMNHRDQRVTGGSWNGGALVEAEVRATGLGLRDERSAMGQEMEQARSYGASSEEAFDRVRSRREADRSRHTNHLVLDLARVLDHYGPARQAQPQTPPMDLLRTILPRMVASELPGVLWIRPATDDERSILADAARNNGE
jgi:hypothetical protein